MRKTYDELKHVEEDRVSSHAAHPQNARIGVGLYIKGQISGNEDLDVEGKVEGPVQLGEGKLTVGTGGNLTGGRDGPRGYYPWDSYWQLTGT